MRGFIKNTVFLLLAVAAVSTPGCGEDPDPASGPIPEQPDDSAGAAAADGKGSRYATEVFEYTPAPGQYINDPGVGGMDTPPSTPEEAAAWAKERLEKGLFVSLGAFGGYIVMGFDHDVANSGGDYDFAVFGNAFSGTGGGSSEPGVVWVMEDTNGNGLPDDTWHELRGSEHDDPSTIHDYAVTYTRPSQPGMDVEWHDNLGESGSVAYLKAFHSQDSYYPEWIKENSITLTGTRLPPRSHRDPETGFWGNEAFPGGYADNMGTDSTPLDGRPQANRFRISDAVDSDGNPVKLRAIRFVKVQTAVLAQAGPLGEVSTEVLGCYDLAATQGADDGMLFIINEGNFQYGNASLSIYHPDSREVENEVFAKSNGMKLGDVAQSMTIEGEKGWIVVNNSNVVFAIDPLSAKEKGRIENLTFPRYMHFVDETKAYVTQLWDNRIAIADPRSYSVTGHITIPDMKPGSGSTEQMAAYGHYVFCDCWSYQNRIVKIDTRTDEVVASLEVGLQPNSIAIDRYGKLWTVTDGGYEGSPFGYEPPALVRIDAETFTIEDKFTFALGDACSEICLNGTKDRIYWINDDIWAMDVTASAPPSTPLIEARGTIYYGLTVGPASGDVYVADAIDHQQSGRIYRYSAGGELIDQFSVGISPGAFCWYRQ